MVSVDGTPAQQLTTHQLWGMFRESDRSVHLVMERDGKTYEKKLKLKQLL